MAYSKNIIDFFVPNSKGKPDARDNKIVRLFYIFAIIFFPTFSYLILFEEKGVIYTYLEVAICLYYFVMLLLTFVKKWQQKISGAVNLTGYITYSYVLILAASSNFGSDQFIALLLCLITFCAIIQSKKLALYFVAFSSTSTILVISTFYFLDYPIKGSPILYILTIIFYSIIYLYSEVFRAIIKERKSVTDFLAKKVYNESNLGLLVVSDESKKIIDCNQTFLEGFEVQDRGEIVGLKIQDLEQNFKSTEEIVLAENFNTENCFVLKNGKTVWFDVLVSTNNVGSRNFWVLKFIDISEKKSYEEHLSRLSLVVEQNPGIVTIFNRDGQIEYVNSMFVKATDLDAKSVIGKHIFEYSESAVGQYEEILEQIDQGNNWYGEIEIKVGNKKIIEAATISAIFNSKGDITNYVKVSEDVTTKKEVENKLKLSEEKHRLLFSKANDAIFIFKGNVVIDCNDKALEMFSCERADFINQPMYKFLPEEQPDRSDSILKFYDLSQKAVKGESQFFYWKYKKYTGLQFDSEVSLNAFEINGETLMQIIVRDITRRKEAEEFKNQSIKSYFEIFDSSSDLMCVFNIDGEIIDVNRAIIDRFGIAKKDVINNSFHVLSDTEKNNFDQLQKYIARSWNGNSQKFDWWGKAISGEVFPMEVILRNGSYFGKDVLIANGRDISQRVKYENSLRESEQKFRTLSTSAPVGIFQADADGTIIFINEKLKEISGLENESSFSESWWDMVHEDDRENIQLILKDAWENLSPGDYQYRITNKNDEERWVKAQFTFVKSNNGEVIGRVGTVEDITSQKKAQEERLKREVAEKTTEQLKSEIAEREIAESKLKETLSEKEVLLKEVHHRVKNNLQVISSILNLQSSYVEDNYTLLMLRECQDRIKSMSFIHESLYQTKNFSHVDFGDYVKNLCSNLLYSYASRDNRIKLDFDIDNLFLTLDTAIPSGLIVNELVSNCLKYAFPVPNEGVIKVVLKKGPNGNIIRISDNGIGFPEDVNFLETDSLGLQLVVTLVEQIDGKIELKSDSGTDFTIDFTAN